MYIVLILGGLIAGDVWLGDRDFGNCRDMRILLNYNRTSV